LEPQDPKPASRASSGRPTPQLALKFGSTLRAENFKPLSFALFGRAKGLLFPPKRVELRRFDKDGIFNQINQRGIKNGTTNQNRNK
jgi:hypothetical protein